MITKIIKRNTVYFCDNCKMRQPALQSNCWWCGDMFSNYEDMLIKEQAEEFTDHIKEMNPNESNLR